MIVQILTDRQTHSQRKTYLQDFLFFYPLIPYLAFTLSGLYRPCDWQQPIKKTMIHGCNVGNIITSYGIGYAVQTIRKYTS